MPKHLANLLQGATMAEHLSSKAMTELMTSPRWRFDTCAFNGIVDYAGNARRTSKTVKRSYAPQK
jgi:hypothetical protein